MHLGKTFHNQPLGSTSDFMDDMDDGNIQFDADMGDGWFVYDYINMSMHCRRRPT